MTVFTEDDYLAHYGILRKSGRYPWGSGETPFERSTDFFARVKPLRAEGMTDTEIARGFGMTSTEFREANSHAKNAYRAGMQSQIHRMKFDKGMSNTAIGKQLGIPEPTIRSYLKPGVKDKLEVLENTATVLRSAVDQKRFVDVGAGTEFGLGISRQKMDTAIAVLKDEGYSVHPVKIEQLGTGKFTEMKVLVPPGVTQKEAWMNRNNIQQVQNFSEDGGRSYLGLHPPIQIDSKRIAVNYKETGGGEADGVIYVRPGVKDLSMGSARYAQVRIAVDGTHYLKGMAIQKADLPPGIDLVFNTNKSNTGNKLDAMKKMKDDEDNPFGAIVRQRIEKDANGKEHVTSALNIVGVKPGSGEEGSWAEWSKTLSSQFLSKQAPLLAKQQLAMAYESKKNELDGILALTNPAVKKKLLTSFADGADSSAWHLKAALLPRQMTHVILPIPGMKETEVYAPNFNNGDRVVLVRHPHGGVFELPQLTVNNNHPAAKKIFGKKPAADAVGINAKVAEQLSGADFDGDTVLVIPNNSGRIRTRQPLHQLQKFDAKAEYPAYDGMAVMGGGHYDAASKDVVFAPGKKKNAQTQTEMGKISNLITDMTLRGASDDELARAVKHSMVVIDAEKHMLNYKQSAINNGISALKIKYQGGVNKGAATLISRKKKDVSVLERKARLAKEGGPIDLTTGEKRYSETGRYKTVNGEKVFVRQDVKRILEVQDVHELSSGTDMENLYADHSNKLKALANKARLASTTQQNITRSPSAAKAFASEVASLEASLRVAQRNAPLERQAQVLANQALSSKRLANPDMTQDEIKKIKSQLLDEMRTRTGAGKSKISITDDEWRAIQSGAISNNKLNDILAHADLDRIKELATPKQAKLMTATKLARARTMLEQGYTQADVANALGVSLTTLKTNIKE